MVALPVLLAALGLARQRHWGRALALLAVVAGLSIAAWQWAPGVRGRIDEGLAEMRTYQSSDTAATSWGMRLRLAEHTLDMAHASPVVGHGVGSWLVEWRRRVQPGLLISIHTTPHNEYLLVLSQLGIIGIALLAWVLFAHLRHAWRAGDPGLAALVAWTAIAWTGLFNVVLRDAKFALPLLLIAALGGAAQREAPQSVRHGG
jgi:O-antigen ligase